MHIVTFYSFKGGVGRTMALANTAIALARRGRRVLVVDFDLEAPGLSSYDVFNCQGSDKGILEYVQHYLATNSSADVADHITKCEFEGHPIWIMPAGAADQLYGARFNAVDWQDLYDRRQGYLFFDDLKAQWRRYDGGGFDYVLIDSRTGHTDVGGICTRQLPDSVVIMFAPNEQNVKGLESIVSEIRGERRGPYGRRIKLHFCPSNVPELDDENGILESILNDAQRRLGYNDNASIIHHYNSLELLVHKPFIIAHPNSKLAEEYGDLESAILAGNLDDKDGALLALQDLLEVYEGAPKEIADFVFYQTNETLTEIRERHASQPDIAFYLSRIYSQLGRYEDEIDALSVAIAGGYQINDALRRRAVAELAVERRSDAVTDIRRLLTSAELRAHELVPAIEMLRAVSPEWISIIRDSGAFSRLEPPAALSLVQNLQTDKAGLEFAEGVVRELLTSSEDTEELHQHAANALALALIGLGKFAEAKIALAENEERLLESGTISAIFNWAMADWGEKREPNSRLFAHVWRAAKSHEMLEANYNQCMALCSFVISQNDEGERFLSKAKYATGYVSRIFSCWRYLYVTRDEMMEDLEAMRMNASAGRLEPEFLTRTWQ